MFNKVQRVGLAFLPIVLATVLSIMGCLGLLNARLPHTQHRPTPQVQRGGISTEMVVAFPTPPDLMQRLIPPALPSRAPQIHRMPPMQPLLAAAPLQTRAP